VRAIRVGVHGITAARGRGRARRERTPSLA
jgi:hypothetical protein